MPRTKLLLIVLLLVGATAALVVIPGLMDARLLAAQEPPPGSEPEIPPLPDLIVENIWIWPPSPVVSEPVNIYVTLRNQGNKDVPLYNNFFADLYVDPAVVPPPLEQRGVYTWPVQYWMLPAGKSYTLEPCTHVFTEVRNYVLYAQVDTDHTVGESNEYNNVYGPLYVQIQAPDALLVETHQEFQLGLASGLDISHPDGVIRRGIFWEPGTEPGVYRPDTMVNDITATYQVGYGWVLTTTNQSHPSMVVGDGDVLYAAWEDGRHGGVFNLDIYSAVSLDGGATWSDDVRVNADPISDNTNQLRPALAYDPITDYLYAVWQDGRPREQALHGYDIRFARGSLVGGTLVWQEYTGVLNDDIGTANQLNPSITVSPAGIIYVAWTDRRNGNDDVYMTRSLDGGATWAANVFVTDDPSYTQQDQRHPSIGVDLYGSVFVTWEDWRNPLHPDIYASWWPDPSFGYGFDIDVPVMYPAHETGYRIAPAMHVSTTRELFEYFDPYQGITILVPCDVTVVHVAWQDGQGDDADIHYRYAIYKRGEHLICAPDPCPWPYEFCFIYSPDEVISDFIIDSDYALPPDSPPGWPAEPHWQGEVFLGRAYREDQTYCHAYSTILYDNGVYAIWSDARSFDDWRYEIQMRRIASPENNPMIYEPCEDHHTGILNDNPKLYAYRDRWLRYNDFQPAATRQSNPVVTANRWGQVWVAWDDDRWDDPLVSGSIRNRDVFMTWTGYPTLAIYISPVLDAGVQATWFTLDWYGVTEDWGDLTLQTRFGATRDPPQEDVATNGWTRWTGNPSSGLWNCDPGEGCEYDAPGRPMVGPDGSPYPRSRYFQYKVIIRGGGRRTALSRIVAYYKGAEFLYLPLIAR